ALAESPVIPPCDKLRVAVKSVDMRQVEGIVLRPQPALRVAEGVQAALSADARAGEHGHPPGLPEPSRRALHRLIHMLSVSRPQRRRKKPRPEEIQPGLRWDRTSKNRALRPGVKFQVICAAAWRPARPGRAGPW